MLKKNDSKVKSLVRKWLPLSMMISMLVNLSHVNAAVKDEGPVTRVVDAGGGLYSDITVYEGRLAVAYYEDAANEAKLWLDDGAGGGVAGDGIAQATELRDVDTGSDDGAYASIAVVGGQLAMAYQDTTNSDVKLWVDDGTGGGTAGNETVEAGELRVVEALTAGAQAVNMTVVNSRLAIVYSDDDNDRIRVWVDDGLGAGTAGNNIAEAGELRTIANIGETPSAERYGITAINDQLAISFYHDATDELQLWWDDGNGTGTAGNNVLELDEVRIIDTSGNNGIHSDLDTIPVTGSTDKLACSYYDTTNDNMEIWIDTDRDGVADVAELKSIDTSTAGDTSAITSIHGRALLTFWSDASDDLQLWSDNGKRGGTSDDITNNGGEQQLLDGQAANVGSNSSITRYDGGFAVAYYDTTNVQLKIAVVADAIDDEEDVRIWDSGTSTFSNTFTAGDPLDTGLARAVTDHVSAIDSKGNVYTAFIQSDGTDPRLFLSRLRLDGTLEIWDHSATAWTTTMSDGEVIDGDSGDGFDSKRPQIVIDNNDDVYIGFIHEDANSNDHAFLVRYDTSAGAVQIFVDGTPGWSADLSTGTAVDITTTGQITTELKMAVVRNAGSVQENDVYLAVIQDQTGGANENHLHLFKYDSSATDMMGYDDATPGFITGLTSADPVDERTDANISEDPNIVINSNSDLILGYIQSDGTTNKVFCTVIDVSAGTEGDALIWDEDADDFTSTLTDGEAACLQTAARGVVSGSLDMAIGPNDFVYMVFVQSTTGGAQENHVHCTQVEGAITGDVLKVWDESASDFVANTAGNLPEPIDNSTAARVSSSPRVVVDSNNDAWFFWVQDDATGNDHIHSSFYDLTATDIFIYDGTDYTSSVLTAGTPIDDTTTANLSSAPEVGRDLFDQIYVSYLQEDAADVNRVRLTRVASTTVVGVWDNGDSDFSTTLTESDGIDLGTTAVAATTPKLTMGSGSRAHIGFLQSNGSEAHMYMSRLGEFQGTLANTSFTPASLTAGSVGNVDVAFDLAKALPPYGQIVLTFPAGFTLSSGATTTVTSMTNIAGTLTAAISGQTVTITRSGSVDEVEAGTTVSLTLSNIMTSTTVGSSGSYGISTKNFSASEIDNNLSVAASTLLASSTTLLPRRSSSSGVCLLSREGDRGTGSLAVVLLIVLMTFGLRALVPSK